MMLFDTGILIDHQHGRAKSTALIDKYEEKAISIITYMEFIQNAPNKTKLKFCRDFILDLDFKIIPINREIGNRASIYIEDFSLSHGLRIPDALIAATAVENSLSLITTNYKDFKMIAGLNLI